MMHDPLPPRDRWHSLGCACADCNPRGPADPDRLTANAIAGFSLLGLVAALVLIQLHAWFTGAPGVAVFLGAI